MSEEEETKLRHQETNNDEDAEKHEIDEDDTPKCTTAVDPVQAAMGPMGRWQVWICAVVFLLKFPVAWHQMAIIFLAPPVEFQCANTTIDNQTIDKCSDECPSHVFNRSIFTETIITEWDLVCIKGNLASLSQTINMLGILVGNMVFGTFADKFGRRIPLVVAVIMQLFCGVAASVSPWFWVFVFFRFVTAFATGGTMIASFVLLMEIIGPQWRNLVAVLYQVPFNLGHLTLPLIAYYIRDWHTFQFAISIPSVVLLSYYWLVPESPRWLLVVGRVKDSVEIIKKAAKMNKLPHENIGTEMANFYHSKVRDNKPVSKGNMPDLFKTPQLRSRTFFMGYNWFVCGIGFFGVAQYVGRLGSNIFISVAISAAITLPGNALNLVVLHYFGRKWTLLISNLICGISMLIIAFLPSGTEWMVIALASLGVMGMMSCFNTVYLYSGELFPTTMRNVGIGFCSMVCRIGSMIAPFVAGASVDKSMEWLIPFIFGIIPCIGAVMCLFLPETKGMPLPETVEDVENFGKKKADIPIEELEK